MPTVERPLLAISIRIAATICVATLMALVKLASAKGIALPELLFWRQAMTIPVMLAVLAATGQMHRLRTRLFPYAGDDLVGEDMLALVRQTPGFTRVETASFETRVRLRAWRDDPGFLDAALRVIARRPLDPSTDPQPEALLAVLDDFSDEEKRINVALCATRAALQTPAE